MAKLMTMFLVLIAIQGVLLLYQDQDTEQTQIWKFISNPTYWGSQKFILTLIGIAGGIGLVGIAASTFGFKTDFLIFAPAVAGFITMGIVFTNLARAISGDLSARICPGVDAALCAPSNYLITIFLGPVALYYVWTIVEWWRGKDY